MPSLLLFKYLRVLNIYDVIVDEKEMIDLTALSQLFQLRYLKVEASYGIELPTKLQGLVYLETVHLSCGKIKEIPSDIVHLPRLSYLCLPVSSELIEGIGNFKSLRTLRVFLLLSSVKNIMGLGELINLTELMLAGFGAFLETPKLDALACSIGKLHNLKRLSLHCLCEEDNNLLASLFNPFQHIEYLGLEDWKFPQVPKWIGGLHYLRILELRVEETSTEQIHLLGELPSLVYLKLNAPHVILGKGLFQVLEYFELEAPKKLLFEAGTMPNLRTLHLNMRKWGNIIPVGMDYLLWLREVRLEGRYSDDALSTVMATLLVHPNHPLVKIV